MAIRDRLAKLEDNAPELRCERCQRLPAFTIVYSPEVCNEHEQEAHYPQVRDLIRAGWLRPNAPRHQHVYISDETRALLNAGVISVGDGKPY